MQQNRLEDLYNLYNTDDCLELLDWHTRVLFV